MFRIVKNVFLDHYKSRRQRERRREQSIDGTTESELRSVSGIDSAPNPESALLAAEERRELWAAIERVPEVYRTVLVLADMQGLSYEEIATIVAAPVGTVKSRLNRGRDALRDALETKGRS
jgi:RNA polymerase sigma-70 factor (ECF subfamily)